ncbi:unnamed protein product [Hyaloperonospora brassicae]|uniref:Uncharacterized protein n=1 Tax=Hyaloperonospora brassicae TaxID=162125 RepID=A0AAV0TNA2_HYABA|nr:unnamed protein product [Hyaloperonospora brassicae]
MASIPGARADPEAPASPRSSTASGHDTDTPGHVRRADKRKFLHTTAAQRQCLLEWLELPGNFALLTKPVSAQLSECATASTTSPRLKRLKKMDGYRSMALHMNHVAHTEWSEKTARSRFESFMAAYRKAKRQSPHDLPSFYRRVDALFGPERDSDARRGTPEAVAAAAPTSTAAGPLNEHEVGAEQDPVAVIAPPSEGAVPTTTMSTALSAGVATSGVSDELGSSSPLRKRARGTSGLAAAGTSLTSMIMAGPLQERARQEAAEEQALQVESQRLVLKQQELELKQLELRARQEESHQKLRADVLTRLVEAGKSPAEVREYLALMDPVDRLTPPRR